MFINSYVLLLFFCYFFFFGFIFWKTNIISFIFLVDIIKPKPLPRNVINGNFTQANSSNNNSTINETNSTTTTTTTSSEIITTMATTTAKTVNSNAPVVTASISKTESLIQRFSFNSSNTSKSSPDVVKRISSKQIATIFEVTIHIFKQKKKYQKKKNHVWLRQIACVCSCVCVAV